MLPSASTSVPDGARKNPNPNPNVSSKESPRSHRVIPFSWPASGFPLKEEAKGNGEPQEVPAAAPPPGDGEETGAGSGVVRRRRTETAGAGLRQFGAEAPAPRDRRPPPDGPRRLLQRPREVPQHSAAGQFLSSPSLGIPSESGFSLLRVLKFLPMFLNSSGIARCTVKN